MQSSPSMGSQPYDLESLGDELSSTNLFVANLPDTTTDEALRSMFCNFGTIVSCKVMVDFNTGRTRGFGFVKFSSPSEGLL